MTNEWIGLLLWRQMSARESLKTLLHSNWGVKDLLAPIPAIFDDGKVFHGLEDHQFKGGKKSAGCYIATKL